MATKRKAEELTEINTVVLKYLQENNLGETAKIFAKEAKLKGVSTDNAADLSTLYSNFAQKKESTVAPATKKAKIDQAPAPASKSVPMEEDDSSSSSSSSDSDSDSDSEKKKVPAKVQAKPAAPAAKVVAKKDSSSSSESSSDESSSEDEKPAAKAAPAAKPAAVPAKAAQAKKAASSSSSSSSSESSSDDSSDDEKPAAKPAAKAAPAAATKKAASSSSSSSSSDSSSDESSEDEKPKPKAAPVAAKKVSSSESSSDDSDSDSESSEDEKPAAPAKKAAPAPTPKKKDSSSSSSSSSGSSDESSSSSDEEEEKPVIKNNKNSTPAAKQDIKKSTIPAATTPKGGNDDGKAHKIYVKGLPWQATEEEVREFFQECGTITSCELPLDENGRSSGTAYVKFSSRAELDAALALDGQTWKDTTRWLKIVESTDKQDRKSFGAPVGERPEGCDTVFVGNLPWDVDEETMRTLFSEAGEVSNVRFATGEDGSFRGFGHVQFYNGEDTVNAIKLAGRQVNGRAIRVDYAPPRNRDSLGGAKSPGRGGGRGSFEGGRGRGGGRGGGRGRGGSDSLTPAKKNTGAAVAGSGKKTTFDD